MSKRISRATKLARGQGSGEGAKYKSYVMTNEFNSLGTTSVIKDWKTGRGVHCLSQAEALWFYILRWDDNNIDIRSNTLLTEISQAGSPINMVLNTQAILIIL